MRFLGVDPSGRPDELEPLLMLAVNEQINREYDRLERDSSAR